MLSLQKFFCVFMIWKKFHISPAFIYNQAGHSLTREQSIFIIFIHFYISVYSHSPWTYVICILSPDYCRGCSWIEMYCFCLRPLILHHINFAKILENSTVTHLKYTQDTRVTSVTLLWRTLTWSVVEGKLCPVCFCLEVLWSALSICSCCYLNHNLGQNWMIS